MVQMVQTFQTSLIQSNLTITLHLHIYHTWNYLKFFNLSCLDFLSLFMCVCFSFLPTILQIFALPKIDQIVMEMYHPLGIKT